VKSPPLQEPKSRIFVLTGFFPVVRHSFFTPNDGANPLPRGRERFTAGVKPGMLGVGVKLGLAWTHSMRATPGQEIVEGDGLQACFSAGHRKAHETPIAAIQPIVIVAVVR
jgi:hypothetical protein